MTDYKKMESKQLEKTFTRVKKLKEKLKRKKSYPVSKLI